MDALERENQELRDALDEAHARMDGVRVVLVTNHRRQEVALSGRCGI